MKIIKRYAIPILTYISFRVLELSRRSLSYKDSKNSNSMKMLAINRFLTLSKPVMSILKKLAGLSDR